MDVRAHRITRISSILTMLLSIVVTVYSIVVCVPWDNTINDIGIVMDSIIMRSCLAAICLVMLVLNGITVHYTVTTHTTDQFTQY